MKRFLYILGFLIAFSATAWSQSSRQITRLGDANGDGQISLSDLASVIDYLGGYTTQPIDHVGADVNADLKVDDKDLEKLVEILLGKSLSIVLPEEIEQVDIENEAVKAYLGQNIASKPIFGSSTWATTTALNKKYLDHDTPIGKTITWEGNEGDDYRVVIIDLMKEHQGKFPEISIKGISYTCNNLVPGHVYYYVVRNADRVEVKSGFFKIKDNQVRMVKITDSWNWRDLGGWPSTLGGHVKYEWLYRGGSLNGEWKKELTFGFLNLGSDADKSSSTDIANPENYEFSQISRDEIIAMGIQSELDFRNTKEEKSDKDYSHALALQNTAGQAIPNTGIDGWTYERIKTSDALSSPLGNDAVVRDVEYLIDQVLSGHPTAFHCKSGADRTGAVAFVILALLGVEEGFIAQDYELTNYSSELGRVQKKSPAFRDRKANDKSKEINTFLSNGIKKSGYPGNTLQEKAYYYLNQQFTTGTKISASKLDAFIDFMLEGR